MKLALVRRKASCPIALLESVAHRRGFRPFLDAYSVDVAIVDVIWNGLFESLKIAAMADAYEVNGAPHNYSGHLSSVIGAAPASFVAIALWQAGGGNTVWVGVYLAVAAVLTLVALFLTAETRDKDYENNVA